MCSEVLVSWNKKAGYAVLLGGGFTNTMYRIRFMFIALILLQFATFQATLAQTNSYKQTNLVSDTAGSAPNVDTKLVNPWGIAYCLGQTFWIADNNSGYSTVYNQVGVNAGSFLVPPPAGSSNLSTPTGIVANVAANGSNVNGKPGLFIMDTEDGTISAWNGSDPVTLVVDNSKLGAVYKGLALISAGNTGNFLLATNFNSGAVEVFDSNFMPAQLTGNFTDPNLPAGLLRSEFTSLTSRLSSPTLCRIKRNTIPFIWPEQATSMYLT
jgi:uncharacterized protein (TIGR03118 family)